jgi:tetratricopeptide (TPR) repeat protein
LGQLGFVAYKQFEEARAAQHPEAALVEHLSAAISRYHQALELLPPNAVNDLAVTRNQLGNIYLAAGDIDRALPHYREAIRYAELVGDLYRAGTRRFNVAVTLYQANRLADARDYAQAALRNYEDFGPAAAADIEKTRRWLADIERAMAGA